MKSLYTKMIYMMIAIIIIFVSGIGHATTINNSVLDTELEEELFGSSEAFYVSSINKNLQAKKLINNVSLEYYSRKYDVSLLFPFHLIHVRGMNTNNRYDTETKFLLDNIIGTISYEMIDDYDIFVETNFPTRFHLFKDRSIADNLTPEGRVYYERFMEDKDKIFSVVPGIKYTQVYDPVILESLVKVKFPVWSFENSWDFKNDLALTFFQELDFIVNDKITLFSSIYFENIKNKGYNYFEEAKGINWGVKYKREYNDIIRLSLDSVVESNSVNYSISIKYTRGLNLFNKR